jgi:hypothetical protein
MKHYLLSMMQPDGPPPANVSEIMEAVRAVNEEMRAAGVWVFSDGLDPAGSAAVVRLRSGEILVTEGPYTKGQEHLGGIYVIRVPDLDAALAWSRKIVRASTLPIEVRAFRREA